MIEHKRNTERIDNNKGEERNGIQNEQKKEKCKE